MTSEDPSWQHIIDRIADGQSVSIGGEDLRSPGFLAALRKALPGARKAVRLSHYNVPWGVLVPAKPARETDLVRVYGAAGGTREETP